MPNPSIAWSLRSSITKQRRRKNCPALYRERWEIETTLGELTARLRGSRIVLRSRTSALVRQELYGLMMARFAIRGLMHEAALKADEDPDRLSFIHAVRVVRRNVKPLPPSVLQKIIRIIQRTGLRPGGRGYFK